MRPELAAALCRTVSACCGLALLTGCGPNKGDQIFDARNDIALAYCECAEVLGTTRAACIADVEATQPTEEERLCIRRVYDRNGPALDPSASCTLDAATTYEGCVMDAECDEASLRSCEDAFDGDSASCESVPDDIQAELVACFM